jgi:hypothetical protein
MPDCVVVRLLSHKQTGRFDEMIDVDDGDDVGVDDDPTRSNSSIIHKVRPAAYPILPLSGWTGHATTKAQTRCSLTMSDNLLRDCSGMTRPFCSSTSGSKVWTGGGDDRLDVVVDDDDDDDGCCATAISIRSRWMFNVRMAPPDAFLQSNDDATFAGVVNTFISSFVDDDVILCKVV